MRFLEVGESMLSPRNEHHFLGAAIGGIFGTLQQSSTNRANFRNTQTTNKFNMQEAQKQRDWQEKMVDESRKYNSPESMISRGLNPFLSGSAAQTGAGSGSSPSGAQASAVNPVPYQAFHPDFSSVDTALASFAQAKKLISESNQINAMTPYMIEKMKGDTNYKQIGIGESGYWNKQTGRISAELDQSMERQQLENAVTAGKLSAAQISQVYLQSDSQAVLNKYMDAQQQADLFTKSQYLYNLVQQGALTEKQVKTELQRAIQIAAQTQSLKISNKIAAGTADALMSATNMAYYTQYYDSLWDYKNVNNRKNMQYSKDKALRDYYKWSAGNAKKDFDSYGLRNAVDYGTKIFQNMPKLKFSSRGNPSSANGIGIGLQD
uniref:Minor capsid protein n=1 Tax=Microviridae sp. ctJby12 TaxID=2827622 RepID=A0A8S5LMJ7_9VIRU|nr:MAG TPA: minor capsid protein [Microviridae sp. ctJby12]